MGFRRALRELVRMDSLPAHYRKQLFDRFHVGPGIQTQERLEFVSAGEATCSYCNRVGTMEEDPDGNSWHIDHIQPRSVGGSSERENLTLACRHCNLHKGAQLGWAPRGR